ncbi:glucosylceramidase [Pedobacter psychrotolerans]|uniref:Glucosylceramidase n=1 Tax=Pedobacter psychrotolerans TaxID=1843235 RepID=A0A4R2HHI8_9SPHI|nr:glycoside hydrolase family 30 beta sandwich domain-containing protein [Pedobacter psychrotolerans]TCO28674.1 glucosylceramidase [Pedobacter psychrotolerans]GGE50868.1 glucosylceramidase [Pedobacter psychrotolerans]
MKFIYNICLVTSLLLSACASRNVKSGNEANQKVTPNSAKNEVGFWLTKGDQSQLLQKQNVTLNFSDGTNSNPTIEVDPDTKFQTIDGFGYTLTGGSATLINALPATEKENLLNELFSATDRAIRINYLRISIGASDLSATPFTYNDLAEGETDESLAKFSIAKEQADLIPILKKIVSINPSIKILGSPWTAPTWMKTNKSFIGGSLKPEYYQTYAKYLAKYIQAMKAEGIVIDAITPQNEPLHPGNNPSMYMAAVDQANFIKTALGPVFKNSGIKTKIIIYDHNADKPEYPITILNDAEAKKYVDGSAFHLYAGPITALSKVHDAHPDKNVYFTEQWVGGPSNFSEDLKWHVSTLIIGATRNWSRNVLEWNLAADPNYNPHTDKGGCTSCLGAITIAPAISRNVAYYVIGHASKFVPAGSVRIASNVTNNLQNVAFKTPDGKNVLIVCNNNSTTTDFNIKYKGKIMTSSLDQGAVATYVW